MRILVTEYRWMWLRNFPAGLAALLSRRDWRRVVNRAFVLGGTRDGIGNLLLRVSNELWRVLDRRLT
jgi:hypothetical protein